MEKYNVTGMTCAACQARVEKAVNAVPGVTGCSVSLLTNSMGVEGSAEASEIIRAVEAAGYGASPQNGGASTKKDAKGGSGNQLISSLEDSLADRETPVLRRRLISSIVFVLVLMYFSMGHTMLHWPVPAFLDGNVIGLGLVQMILAEVVLLINQKFFVSGVRGVLHGSPNMDTLIALGSGASFLWSVIVLFMYSVNPEIMEHFYFESAAMIPALITVGKMLEAKSKGRTTDALKSLMKLAPKTATVLRVSESTKDEIEEVVPAEQVEIGDLFIVRPGESIPVDGIVVEGSSAVNESALTGESIPVDKSIGMKVSAATINQSGFLKCKATRVGEDTTLSQIIQMVSDAAATKAPIARVADKVSGIFVPVVISIAVISIIIWMLLGADFSYALARGIAVLVISCPCALGLATPVAIMVGNGKAARNGVLFKTSESLEQAGKADIIVLDKTGTITKGTPEVTDVIGADYSELLSVAYSLEKMSEHPLAKAVTGYCELVMNHSVTVSGQVAMAAKIEIYEIQEFQALVGSGVKANYQGEVLMAGNAQLMEDYQKAENYASLMEAADGFAKDGKTPLFFAKGKTLLGVIAVADTVKEDSREAIAQLTNMGIRVVMLTGDNEQTAQAIAAQVGVTEVVAGVLPDGKEAVVRSFKEQGVVAMVGDGINDAPALTRADIGIAIGAGTDVAIDAADVVLVKSRLLDVTAAVRMSRATLLNIHENLFWAFFYNVIAIPLAAGCYVAAFGWSMNPMIGALAMSLSSFCVVMNALRLNLFSVYSTKHDRKRKKKSVHKGAVAEAQTQENKKSEVKEMTKTMHIEGMMCGHCEARVKKTLEAIEGVAEAVVSHEAGTAVVTLSAEVSDETLKAAVEAQDYPVTAIN